MAVVFDLLRTAEYRLRIKNGISWETFWFQNGECERVKSTADVAIQTELGDESVPQNNLLVVDQDAVRCCHLCHKITYL